jgi:multiple antibiotic resistance protein
MLRDRHQRRAAGQLVGRTGLRAISKIISLLLAAIAIAMIRRGLGR